MKRHVMALAAVVTVVAGAALEAQNPGASAIYATVNLNGGFMPDPHVIQLTAGGSVTPGVPGCSFGRVANSPDVKVNYSGDRSRTLYIYSTASEDVTLLVNLPNGSWACNDDGLGNRNPLVIVSGASSGRYDIWVGTYGQSTTSAQLMISEIDPRSRASTSPSPQPLVSSPSSGINPGAPAIYATRNLSGGFMPDPNTTQLTAGGSNAVNIGGCTFGRVASAPDVKLHYSGNQSRTLYIYATSGTDVTLLVNMPDASWRCDDDGLGNGNPLLTIFNAPSGRYDIWVGTYGQGTAPAQLMISEINPR